MTASIGVWKEQTFPGGVVYRWSADDGNGQSGHVLLDTERSTARPCDAAGQPIGDLRLDLAGAEQLTGTASGVDTGLFVRVAGAVLESLARIGIPPETAHRYYH